MRSQDIRLLAFSLLLRVFGSEAFIGTRHVKHRRSILESRQARDTDGTQSPEDPLLCDVAIVGAGLGGLCAGAILNTIHGKKVIVCESHYLAGGCAHAFERKASNGKIFTFDSGPTILLGCSQKPFSAIRQVLDAVGKSVDWIRYDGWGLIENPGKNDELRWKCELGPDSFQNGPLLEYGGDEAVHEFNELRESCRDLVIGVGIPTMAMRPGAGAVIPLLRYFPTLVGLIKQGSEVTGTFAPYMDGPKFVVKNQWLRDWLDALAFSLSGLPASRTAAAAMAFVLDDMHREGAALDYPKGGLGAVIDALVQGLEQGSNGSRLRLRQEVASIDFDESAERATGLTLKNGRKVLASEGVICNAPVWSLRSLLKNEKAAAQLGGVIGHSEEAKPKVPESWVKTDSGATIRQQEKRDTIPKDSFLETCDTIEMTGSFLHLHVAIDSSGLDLDSMEAHYTVMDRGLNGDGSFVGDWKDGPCGEQNMIAVSNPCVIDPTLAPEGFMVLHAYGAGNEPYERWENTGYSDPEYSNLKEERAEVLWRALESVIPDVRSRVVLDLIGSPKTHERFLNRPRGTYGAATEDYLQDGSTPISNFVLAGDSVFPGIGVPSVAISGASAANSFITPLAQLLCLDQLTRNGAI